MSAGSTFTAAMVQMRTGLLPEPSLEQGTGLIREAAAQGADYVLTPEVSNMMQLNRKALFEHLASEEDDKSLKAYRALAAELKIHLHIGSLALLFSPEKAVNRSFLIGPDGNLLASYDKIHMFDIELPDGPRNPVEVVTQLHRLGSPATTASAGGRFFGLVVGATLPAALGARMLTSVWDQVVFNDLTRRSGVRWSGSPRAGSSTCWGCPASRTSAT